MKNYYEQAPEPGMEQPCELEDRLGMTEEQWEWFQRETQGYGEHSESGVDLSLIRSNLRLTPTQRLEKHRQAMLAVMEVRSAGEELRSHSSSSPK
jgi:hypothetical protein